jgi:hypothetical protein
MKKLMSELLTQYLTGDKIEKKELGGECNTYGNSRGVYRVLMEKTMGKRPLGRPKLRWNDNNKMDLQEVGCECMDWIDLSQDRDRWWALSKVVMNLRIP